MKHRAERYDSDIYRIFLANDLVGFASRLSNGKWSATDKDERRISAKTFEKPRDVAAHFDTPAIPAPDKMR